MNRNEYNRNSYNQNASNWSSTYSLNNYTHSHIEKPAIMKALGDIKGKSIIAIGCGSGEEVGLFYEKGATVVGFDQSEELIKIAQKNNKEMEFFVGDAESYRHPEKFDIAYAGFVAHYFKSWDKFLRNSSDLLRPKAELIFSIVHPIKRNLTVHRINGRRYSILGSNREEDDRSRYQIFGDYLNPHEDRISFGEGFDTIQYHRPIGEQINDITRSSFDILDVIEPKPIASAKQDYPNKFEIDNRIPRVMIYHLRKRD